MSYKYTFTICCEKFSFFLRVPLTAKAQKFSGDTRPIKSSTILFQPKHFNTEQPFFRTAFIHLSELKFPPQPLSANLRLWAS